MTGANDALHHEEPRGSKTSFSLIASLWQYWHSLSYPGLIFGTLFFAASVTPSLLPRIFWVQGILSGVALATGYGVGRLLVWVWTFLELPTFAERTDCFLRNCIAVAAGVTFVLFLGQMTFWQNSIRRLMAMPELTTSYPLRTALVAIAVGIFLIAVARLIYACIDGVFSWLTRFFPRRVSWLGSIVLVLFGLLFVVNDVVFRQLFVLADTTFGQWDSSDDQGMTPPVSKLTCGGKDSLIQWSTIGLQGRRFLTTGPKKEDIQQFLQTDDVLSPIRVYAGLRSANDLTERAELVVDEFERLGGFQRSAVIVANPTGTGWLDPSALDPVEYLTAGDVATVSMQYSYLPSWLTLIAAPDLSKQSARTLFQEVYSRWRKLPADQRPELYLHGLSLGAYGMESAVDFLEMLEDPINGMLLSGAPSPSARWQWLTENRKEDSPMWQPEFSDSRTIRFLSSQNSWKDPGENWGPLRVVYLQYASDPMVFCSPDLMWQKPDWLTIPRGPDVTEHLRWYPMVTFLQIAFDLPLANTPPLGYAHNYAPADYIDAWVQVLDSGWSRAQVDQLKEAFADRKAVDIL